MATKVFVDAPHEHETPPESATAADVFCLCRQHVALNSELPFHAVYPSLFTICGQSMVEAVHLLTLATPGQIALHCCTCLPSARAHLHPYNARLNDKWQSVELACPAACRNQGFGAMF
eukprot:364087-Chlamydomonas_euryale.AAC.1